MRTLVYLSLGSNVGDREKQLKDAITRLQSAGKVVAVSSFYETEPVEFIDQAWFLNCAAALETMHSPQELITTVLNIEHEMGRQRTLAKGPRSIDIDILLFGDALIETEELTVPHPAMQLRRFVLEPLAESHPRHDILRCIRRYANCEMLCRLGKR